jgi:hypothetical protein
MILTTVLLAAAGCKLIPRRDKSGIHNSPPVRTPTPPPVTPSPMTPAPGSPSAARGTPTPRPFPVQDQKFLDTASRIFAYQRKLGSLGKQYGNTDEARNLGSLMETEMALGGDNLKTLATYKKRQIGAGAGWGNGGLERLASERGEGFDRKFYEEVKQSGSESYAEFDRAFRAVTDSDVRDFARNWYPVLRNYPREAIKLELKLDKKHR